MTAGTLQGPLAALQGPLARLQDWQKPAEKIGHAPTRWQAASRAVQWAMLLCAPLDIGGRNRQSQQRPRTARQPLRLAGAKRWAHLWRKAAVVLWGAQPGKPARFCTASLCLARIRAHRQAQAGLRGRSNPPGQKSKESSAAMAN